MDLKLSVKASTAPLYQELCVSVCGGLKVFYAMMDQTTDDDDDDDDDNDGEKENDVC